MKPRNLNIFVCHASGHPTDVLPHGDGLLALAFIRLLAQRGHHLHVALDRSTIQGPLPGSVELHRLNGGDAGPDLNPLVHMIRSRRLYQRLRKTVRFDLIHQLNPAFTGMSLAMVGSDVPVVIGPYAGNWMEDQPRTPVHRLRELIRMRIRRIQQRHASAILLWNNTARINVERTGALKIPHMAAKLSIVPPGIDTECFSPEPRPKSDRLIVLFLANIVRRKGIFTLLAAFEKVAAELPGCDLHIAGDGPDLPAAQAVAANSSFADRIRFLGRAERSAIPSLMRSCDVYCLPSCGEPFGMTALEAMACGKPVVVTDAGGLTELVSCEGGRKATPNDPVSLSQALLEVLRSPELRLSLGEANRNTAVASYAWPRVIDRLEQVYHALVSGDGDPELSGERRLRREALTTT